MKTDDLIQKLSIDLKPVKTMLSPLYMTALFVLIGFMLIGLSFIMMSARENLIQQLSNSRIQFELVISFLLAVTALSLSVFLSRPGNRSTTQKIEKVTFGFLLLVLMYDGFRVAQLSQSQIHLGLNLTGMECFMSVLGFSIMLGGAMMYWLRQGASINPRLSGIVIGTACVAFGNVSITFFCGIDNGMHILIWHFALPMIVAFCFGLVASRFLLKW